MVVAAENGNAACALSNRESIALTPKRLLSKKELAAVLNVSERTIDYWCAQKRIPRLCLSARLTRFSLPRVEAALARYEIKEVEAPR
jgi:hypothetical protein